MTAAAPNPAPRPAARPVLLEPPLLSLAVMLGPSVEVEDALAAAGDPEGPAVGDPEEVPSAPDVVAAALSLPVLVPAVFNGCSVNGALVLLIPGQLVLPITVTVEG